MVKRERNRKVCGEHCFTLAWHGTRYQKLLDTMALFDLPQTNSKRSQQFRPERSWFIDRYQSFVRSARNLKLLRCYLCFESVRQTQNIAVAQRTAMFTFIVSHP